MFTIKKSHIVSITSVLAVIIALIAAFLIILVVRSRRVRENNAQINKIKSNDSGENMMTLDRANADHNRKDGIKSTNADKAKNTKDVKSHSVTDLSLGSGNSSKKKSHSKKDKKKNLQVAHSSVHIQDSDVLSTDSDNLSHSMITNSEVVTPNDVNFVAVDENGGVVNLSSENMPNNSNNNAVSVIQSSSSGWFSGISSLFNRVKNATGQAISTVIVNTGVMQVGYIPYDDSNSIKYRPRSEYEKLNEYEMGIFCLEYIVDHGMKHWIMDVETLYGHYMGNISGLESAERGIMEAQEELKKERSKDKKEQHHGVIETYNRVIRNLAEAAAIRKLSIKKEEGEFIKALKHLIKIKKEYDLAQDVSEKNHGARCELNDERRAMVDFIENILNALTRSNGSGQREVDYRKFKFDNNKNYIEAMSGVFVEWNKGSNALPESELASELVPLQASVLSTSLEEVPVLVAVESASVVDNVVNNVPQVSSSKEIPRASLASSEVDDYIEELLR